MKIFVLILVILATLFFTLLLIKKRRQKRAVFQGNEKHPNGFLKYHRQTKLRVKAPIELQKPSASAEANNVAVLRFKGDLRATQKTALSHIVDEIILNREAIKQVVVVIESPGGSVTDYGQCYSEVRRIRDAAIFLEICVDTVAASGGYLMCLPANHIIAAPFSMVGSIGVVSFVPNIRKLLESWNIQPRTFTSGQFKRTVSLTDQATEEDLAHFNHQLALVHEQFKQALKEFRPQVELDRVATGEAWLAQTSQELKLGLVDQVSSSSEHLLKLNRNLTLVEFYEESRGSPLKRWLQLQMETLLGQTLEGIPGSGHF